MSGLSWPPDGDPDNMRNFRYINPPDGTLLLFIGYTGITGGIVLFGSQQWWCSTDALTFTANFR